MAVRGEPHYDGNWHVRPPLPPIETNDGTFLWRCRHCGGTYFLRTREDKAKHWRGCGAYGDYAQQRAKEQPVPVHRWGQGQDRVGW